MMKWLWLAGAALSIFLGFATNSPGSVLPAAICVWAACDAAHLDGVTECTRIYAAAIGNDTALGARLKSKLTAYFAAQREANGQHLDD